MQKLIILIDKEFSGLFTEFFGGLILLVFVFIFFGLPKRIFLDVKYFFRSKSLEKKLAQGPFDSDLIARSIKYYIRPMCSNVDPSIEDEPLHAISKVREPLFDFLDRFLKYRDSKEKHLLLLADSGMGKTSFFVNYFNYRSGFISRCSIRLISLSQPDCDKIISKIPLEDRSSIDIFLDALDEDLTAYGRVRERIGEILNLTSAFRSVVISCRTQFFARDDEIPAGTGLFKVAPVSAGESKIYQFQKIYLSPFDDRQINEYIGKRYPGLIRWRVRGRARAIVQKVPALSVRPMLLAHMPEIIGQEEKIVNSVGVYAAMVDAWLLRESWWVSPEVLRSFSMALAIEYHVNRLARGGDSATPEEIIDLARSWHFDLDLTYLTSRSLLNRTSDGRYKFAHRSIMEYFVVEALFSGRAIEECQLTDQMIFFLVERLGLPASMSGIFYGKGVEVRCVRPKTVLGYATDYSLFQKVYCNFEQSKLMRVGLTKYMNSDASVSLGDALAHIGGQANYLSAGGVRETVLRLESVARIGYVHCRCISWLRNGAILVDMLLNQDDLSDLCPEISSLSERNEVMISIDGLGQRSAIVSLKNFCVELLKYRYWISFPALSFSNSSASDIRISVHEEYLSGDNTLSEYGLLGSISVTSMDNDAGFMLAPRIFREE